MAQLGFVNRLVKPGNSFLTFRRPQCQSIASVFDLLGTCLEEALKLADRINENAPLAVREARKAVLEMEGRSEEECFNLSMGSMVILLKHMHCMMYSVYARLFFFLAFAAWSFSGIAHANRRLLHWS